MSDLQDFPGDAPTGPQSVVTPPGPQGYAFRPAPPLPPRAYAPPPSRLTKVAASVCLVAGALVIVAVLFGGGFYLGRETAPAPRVGDRSAARVEQGGPMVIPMPRSPFDQSGPGIVVPNGPTFQLPNLFPQLPTLPSPSPAAPPTPGQQPR